MHGNKLPPVVLKTVATKAQEAAKLLALIKPLCKSPQALTEAEADILEQTVRHASQVLRQAMEAVYADHDARWREQEAKKGAIAKA